MRRRWLIQLAILTVSVMLDRAGIRAEDGPSYLKEIRPILAANCFPCHGPDAKVRQAGLRLDQGNSARMRLASGTTAVVPNKAADSELIRRIETVDTELLMPPPESRKLLTAAEKHLLRRWIESGAKSVEHWAYQAPQRTKLPAASPADWSRNAVDAFVLLTIEAAEMSPSPTAGPETLLRRLSLDLIGLPPTLDEVETFLSDSSPDAYERAVDRLLASPHFGEKLAQDWLDLARFGDTSGYQDDNDRPNHPYRDVIIGAFNANLPFDQFTIESLAGDLLPQPTLTQKVLSGFNRLHRYNEEGGSDLEEFRVVYAVDRTNTTAATWMGVSFGCAQCHDHKYDPFTQREYYQLLAFFNSLKGEITVSKGPANPPQIPVPDPAQQKRIDELSRLIAQQESKFRARESQATAAFEEWLKQPLATPPTEKSVERPGAIGGTVARTARPAWYADTRLTGVLTLDTPLRSTGRVTVIKTVNNWKWQVETGSELYRRGLYTFIRRTSPYPSFQTFDVSGRGECTVARARTNTPLQALVTLNDPVFIEAARVLAERAVSQTGPNPRERLIFLVRSVLSRSPLSAEQSVLERLYQTEFERYQADPEAAARVRSQGSALQMPGLDAAEVAAWTAVANALFNLDEAITRE